MSTNKEVDFIEWLNQFSPIILNNTGHLKFDLQKNQPDPNFCQKPPSKLKVKGIFLLLVCRYKKTHTHIVEKSIHSSLCSKSKIMYY